MKRLIYIALALLAIQGIQAQPIKRQRVPDLFGSHKKTHSSAPAPPASTPYGDSLIVYYALDDTTDNHTGSYPLTMYNMGGTYDDTVGVIGNGVRVNITLGSYLQRSDAAYSVMSGNWTVMYWKKKYHNVGNQVVMMIGSFAGLMTTYSYDIGTSWREYYAAGAAGNVVFNAAGNTAWHLITITYDATVDTLRVYDNATPAAAVGLAGDFNITAPILTLGALGDGTLPMNGVLDEFYYWRGLKVSAGFVTWYYNSGAGRAYADVVAYSP